MQKPSLWKEPVHTYCCIQASCLLLGRRQTPSPLSAKTGLQLGDWAANANSMATAQSSLSTSLEHKASLSSFFLASWQLLCQVLAHSPIMNSIYNRATAMHSWESSRRETSSYKNVGAANAGTALVSLQEKNLTFRPFCLYRLVSDGKTPDSISFHQY